MAMGERAPVAILHPAAAARLAVGEAITNIAAAPIKYLSDIALSANWMAAAKELGEGSALYDAVEAIGKGFCPELGISIPVGKDSLSMKAGWTAEGQTHEVTSPLSLVITAAAPVTDVRRVLTPVCCTDVGSHLLLIDLGNGCHSLGGSVLAQAFGVLGNDPPDIDSNILKQFFDLIQLLNEAELIQAYHDRSDGGLLVTLVEMMFASHCGITMNLSAMSGDVLPLLFSEDLGAVIQVRDEDLSSVLQHCALMGLSEQVFLIGELNQEDHLYITCNSELLYSASRQALQIQWTETSYQIQKQRDNPTCVEQAFNLLTQTNFGLSADLTFDPGENIVAQLKEKPKVAILREQGVNGQIEMAAAFMAAGFDAIDVHMSDLLAGRQTLDDFIGLAACGGFSYGDVLGAGRGWAQTILNHSELRAMFIRFFARANTFSLGVCNGCQMLSQLKCLIPGTDHWPEFVRNTSEQFEARLVMTRVEPHTHSFWFNGMQGSVIPVVVSHGEGRVQFNHMRQLTQAQSAGLVALRYVDSAHQTTEFYPENPNGSHQGITGLTSADGRVLVMMPHPERVYRTVQNSWHPPEWGEDGPWLRLFRNARLWADKAVK
jgi:phosphoribosylformylglycinamidine synthase